MGYIKTPAATGRVAVGAVIEYGGDSPIVLQQRHGLCFDNTDSL